jgi:hypothetical protein
MKLSEHVRTLLHKAAQDEAVLAELAEDFKFDDETVGVPCTASRREAAQGMAVLSRRQLPENTSIENVD